MAGDHVDDLKRDWLLNQRDVLNPAELNSYRYTIAELLANGSLYDWVDLVSLAGGADTVYSFTTTDDPHVLLSFEVTFQGGNNSEILVEGFTTGTVSGGAIISPPPLPRNHDNPTASPYLNNDIFSGRTIDVAGVQFSVQFIGTSGGSSQGGGFILNPNTLYYFVVENIGGQAADVAFRMVSGADRL